jgi:hypothetical protein
MGELLVAFGAHEVVVGVAVHVVALGAQGRLLVLALLVVLGHLNIINIAL